MKATIEHRCGHTIRHTLFGALPDRQKATLSRVICPDCQKKRQAWRWRRRKDPM